MGRGVFLYLWSNFIAIPTELLNKLFLSTRIARHRAKKRRGNDESQKTGELQSFHSYTKPGPRVQVLAYADNFFQFLILPCSYIHKLCPWGDFPSFQCQFSYCPHNLKLGWSLLASHSSSNSSDTLKDSSTNTVLVLMQETITGCEISYPAFPESYQHNF